MTQRNISVMGVAAFALLLIGYVASPPFVAIATSRARVGELANSLYLPLKHAIEVTGTEQYYEYYCDWVMGEDDGPRLDTIAAPSPYGPPAPATGTPVSPPSKSPSTESAVR